jgi:hypothetical protein
LGVISRFPGNSFQSPLIHPLARRAQPSLPHMQPMLFSRQPQAAPDVDALRGNVRLEVAAELDFFLTRLVQPGVQPQGNKPTMNSITMTAPYWARVRIWIMGSLL